MKATWLYIVGVQPRDVPPMPLRIDEATHIACHNNSRKAKHRPRRPHLEKRERESTPPPFALFLLEIASRAWPQRLAA